MLHAYIPSNNEQLATLFFIFKFSQFNGLAYYIWQSFYFCKSFELELIGRWATPCLWKDVNEHEHNPQAEITLLDSSGIHIFSSPC